MAETKKHALRAPVDNATDGAWLLCSRCSGEHLSGLTELAELGVLSHWVIDKVALFDNRCDGGAG